MLSAVTLLIAILLMYGFLRKYRGNDSKLPPASTPEGKKARIAGGAILAFLLIALVFNTLYGGIVDRKTSILLAFQGILVVIIIVLIPSLNNKR